MSIWSPRHWRSMDNTSCATMKEENFYKTSDTMDWFCRPQTLSSSSLFTNQVYEWRRLPSLASAVLLNSTLSAQLMVVQQAYSGRCWTMCLSISRSSMEHLLNLRRSWKQPQYQLTFAFILCTWDVQEPQAWSPAGLTQAHAYARTHIHINRERNGNNLAVMEAMFITSHQPVLCNQKGHA